jgi:hypothetical protein
VLLRPPQRPQLLSLPPPLQPLPPPHRCCPCVSGSVFSVAAAAASAATVVVATAAATLAAAAPPLSLRQVRILRRRAWAEGGSNVIG